MNKLTPIAAALMVLYGTAQASSVSSLSTTSYVTTADIQANISHNDNVLGSCGLKFDYGDGSAPEMLLVQVADTVIKKSHNYGKVGDFIITVSPIEVTNPLGNLRPACAGSPVSAKASIIPLGNIVSGAAAPSPVALDNTGTATVTYTFNMNYPAGATGCGAYLNYSDRQGEALQFGPGSQFPTVVRTVKYTQPGTYSATMVGGTPNGWQPCNGTATASVTVLPAGSSAPTGPSTPPPSTASVATIISGAAYVGTNAVPPQDAIFVAQGGTAQFAWGFNVNYPANAVPCSARLSYSGIGNKYIVLDKSNGTVQPNIQYGVEYPYPGQYPLKYQATLTGEAYNGMPACSGSTIAEVVLEPQGAPGATIMPDSNPNVMTRNANLGPNNKPVKVDFGFNVKHDPYIHYACGTKITYGDGSPDETPLINPADPSIKFSHNFTQSGNYDVTITGAPVNNQPACAGSVTTHLTVTPSVGGGTIGTGTATPNPAHLISRASPFPNTSTATATVTYTFPITHNPNIHGACGAWITYHKHNMVEESEGVVIQESDTLITRKRTYSAADTYDMNIMGYPYQGYAPCIGNATSTVQVMNPPSKLDGMLRKP